MVALMLIVSIAAMIALDYFVLQKRRAAREPAEPGEMPGLRPLSDVFRRLPGGVFLQPTYTWSRIREDGEILIGLHPMLYGLVGAPYRLELIHDGAEVERGAPLVRIGREGRWLTVRSPVAGTVCAVNHTVRGEADWSSVGDAADGWLYRVRPQHVSDEVESWFIGERASAWTREQYSRIRSRLAGVAMARSLGVLMADGGEIPAGILGELDERAWRAVQDEFLDS